MAQDKIVNAWVDMLRPYRWDWFITVSFSGNYIHPEQADKIWRLWVSQMNRELHGPRWYKKQKGVVWVRALELQKRGVIHFHGLMRHPEFPLDKKLSRWAEMEVLFELAGISRIYTPRSQHDVINYCAKYVFKEGDIEVSPNFRDPQCDPSLYRDDPAQVEIRA